MLPNRLDCRINITQCPLFFWPIPNIWQGPGVALACKAPLWQDAIWGKRQVDKESCVGWQTKERDRAGQSQLVTDDAANQVLSYKVLTAWCQVSDLWQGVASWAVTRSEPQKAGAPLFYWDRRHYKTLWDTKTSWTSYIIETMWHHDRQDITRHWP